MSAVAALARPLIAATSSFLAGVGTSHGLFASPNPGAFGSGVPDIGLGGYVLNLVVVVAVLVALGYFAARFGKGRLALPVGLRARDLRVEDRLPIDPQRSILVVSHGRRRFLVGMTQYSIQSLAELDPAPDFDQTLHQQVQR